MKFTHVSDTHGDFPKINSPLSILLIHSGDFMPNKTRGIVEEEIKYQEEWVKDNLGNLKDWIGDRVFVFCAGNHDFFDPIPLMQEAGINARNCTNKLVRVCGSSIYGFPYVPFLSGEWNYERRRNEMSDLVGEIPACDILVSHCPPHGILDEDDGKVEGGNTSLSNWIAYEATWQPDFILCGHFHAANGIYLWEMGKLPEPTIVSNAARTIHNFQT